jgi:uncharacterized protein (UPF0264 family)
MTRLLVSVRNPAEAETALRGGAGLIDVKEPANGPLGKADDSVIAAVVQAVAGRAPVSAALGEWSSADCETAAHPLFGLAYVKLGLSGCTRANWRSLYDEDAASAPRTRYPGAKKVLAAYADTHLADSPPVDEVCTQIRTHAGGVFLIDTFIKSAGKSLLDWIPLEKLRLICTLCRSAGVQTALAGSLRFDDIRDVMALRPDWIAVRGAACDGGRGGTISEVRVRELAAVVNCPPSES